MKQEVFLKSIELELVKERLLQNKDGLILNKTSNKIDCEVEELMEFMGNILNNDQGF